MSGFPLPGNATKLQGRNVSANAPTNTQVLTWVTADNAWEPAAAASTGANPNDTFIVATVNGDLPNEVLISTVNGYGTLGARPAAGTAGFSYYTSDTNALYRDNGASWVNIPIGTTYSAGAGLSLAGTVFSLTAPVAATLGGTGVISPTAHQLLVGAGASAVVSINEGTATQALISNGPGVDPSFQAIDINTATNGALVNLLARLYLK